MHDEISIKNGKIEVNDVSKFFKDIAHDKRIFKAYD